MAVALVLPLAFVPVIDDAYALTKVALLQVAALVGAASFLGYAITGGSLTRGASRLVDLPLLAFAGLTVVSTIASVDRRQSLIGEPYQYQGLVTTLAYVASFYAARLSLGTVRRFPWLLWAIVASGMITVAYAWSQWLGQDPFRDRALADGRVIAGLGQPNDLASFLLIVLCAAYGIWRLEGGGRPLFVAGLVAVIIGALAVTFSRGGYLALGCLILVLGALHVRPARRPRSRSRCRPAPGRRDRVAGRDPPSGA